MFTLDRNKLDAALHDKGLSLSRFAKECRISRQSLYNMFKGKGILTVSFEKLLDYLNVKFKDIVIQPSDLDSIMKEAPESVKKATLELQKFAEVNKADLFLIGSRARGKKGLRADWDFAIYFKDPKKVKSLALIKQKIGDLAFPYRIDLVVLSAAPSWFLYSASDEAIRICGYTKKENIFKIDKKYKGAA